MERISTIVIGAGQAGLSVGYHLARLGVPFVILEANERVGDNWRARWDSLRLFTPARFDGLDGRRFPASPHTFPTKNEMAEYLENYARHFKLPVRTGVRVDRLERVGDHFVVTAGAERFEADNVVVAMAVFQKPVIPALARQLDPQIVQVHSVDYQNPAQLRPGDVLIAGAGNSGAEIAVEVARTHKVWLAGRDVGHIPFNISGLPARLFLATLMLRFVFHRVLTVDTPMGRKARPNVIKKGGPLIRQKPADLEALGVQRVPRVARVQNGKPVLADERVLDVANVIWCTGFHPGFSWIDLPIFDERGEPRHDKGSVPEVPGLYFVGLHFLYALSSTMIHGVGRDAERVARAVSVRRSTLVVAAH
jgi:putative flavoprotein involved in K+ transport